MTTRRGRYTPDEYRQRPRDFDPSLCDTILDAIMNGEMLGDILDSDRDLPLPGTFLRWVDEDPHLRIRYQQARRIGAEYNIDESVSAAYDMDVQRGAQRSRALLKHAEKTDPTRYGPRAIAVERPTEEPTESVDYSASVRRKIEAMAAKVAGSPLPVPK